MTQRKPEVKAIAFYLPQFHPIPENDLWWGEGFTEWTNVRKAKPNFDGHYQPREPGELGYYDLRDMEVQKRQIELAKEYGVHGFCFYYYWFNGKRLLERPLDQFVENKHLDFPFCVCWANENWTKRWDGLDNEILIAQDPTIESYHDFIKDVAPILRDDRYIRINGKPLLIVYRASHLPSVTQAVEIWRNECIKLGVGEIFLAAVQSIQVWDPRPYGFDAAIEFPPFYCPPIYTDLSSLNKLNPDFRGRVQDYRITAELKMLEPPPEFLKFRTVIPSWDNTARMQNNSIIFNNSSPKVYKNWLKKAIEYTQTHLPTDHQYVFINAWNEWAEGAYLEPDKRHGRDYLQATKEALEMNPMNEKITQTPAEEIADLLFLVKTLYNHTNELEIERLVKLAERDAQMAERDIQLAAKDTQLAERGFQLAAKDTQLAERDVQLAAKDAQLTERDVQLAAKHAQLADRDIQLREIYSSKVWKLGLWLRRVRLWIAPPGSVRAKMGSAILSTMKKIINK